MLYSGNAHYIEQKMEINILVKKSNPSNALIHVYIMTQFN